MMHHGLAVGADLDIGLDAVAAGDGGGESRGSIFDHAASGVMQSAMRDGPRGEPVETGNYFTSNMPSTSTAASAGSADTPTVERA